MQSEGSLQSNQILKSSLADFSKRKTAELDWQTQSFELNFDLPAHDWYDKLDLFLSAYPEGDVSRTTPLLISYNGAKPVPLYGRASRFDAHIRMDTSRIRLAGNTLKITYKTPIGSSCLTPDNGKWVLDLSRSKLVASVRAKKRTMQIVEIEKRLIHPMTAPKRVGIIAAGKNKLAYEALAAQAIAQRMDFVPDFKLGSGVTDMVVLVGTYADLAPWLKNKSLKDTKFTGVLIDASQKPTLILGGETEDQVLELVRAFASHHLPRVQRGSVSLQDLYSSPELSLRVIVDNGQYKLSDIGNSALDPSWRPDPATVKFNVVDPYRASGVLTLHIHNAKDINPKSRLSVSLNDRSIGYTYLNKSSKMVEFNIKPGLFAATNNRLSFAPKILPGDNLPVCGTAQNIPTILVSGNSSFRITTGGSGPATELSRFAATGAPFDKNAVIVLTARSLKDRQASLKLLAYAARQFGPKWTNADYVNTLPTSGTKDKNILFIGPEPMSDPVLLSAAPGGLKLALNKKRGQKRGQKRGKPQAGLRTSSGMASGQFASSNVEQVIKTLAAQNMTRLPTSRLQSGGLAALFTSPYNPDNVVGLISSDHSSKFASAMDRIVTEGYWNALRGSVVRWDNQSILMTQTTIPHTSSASVANAPAGFVATVKNWFGSLSLDGKPPNKLTPAPSPGVASVTGAEKLRGALPSGSSLQERFTDKASWWALRSQASAFAAPSMTRLKRASLQTRHNIQVWWNNTISATLSSTFKKPKFRKWRQDIARNPTAFLLLIVFLAFFLTALNSPMSPRRKKKTKFYS